MNVFSGIGGLLAIIQLLFAVIFGIYIWSLLRNQKGSKTAVVKESSREKEKIKRMRLIALTEPLSSLTRPTRFSEVIGQDEGIEVLRAALCGPNPQHVIIYGPPGIGKTAAARLVLEEAKANDLSPFTESSVFVEVDGTVSRFDERGIADPLIGSVHDPIYQGAGPMGQAGVPQPKPGAVTKAHGGVLFIDEIGELHPVQMNKLLKVIEDRKVMLESAYYSKEDGNVPAHIHDMFQNGLPADFRLVGATTRMPDQLPPALRSRCLEIFFRPLEPSEVRKIAENAVERIGFRVQPEALDELARYASNGREAVNMIQLAAGIALGRGLNEIERTVLDKVIQNGQYSPRMENKRRQAPGIGVVNGLAVAGPNVGSVIEVEAVAIRVEKGMGHCSVTGVIDEEEMGSPQRTVRRKSMARGAVENVLTSLRAVYGIETRDFDIHINFPGGIPVDGPSAGVAMAAAIYSAISGIPVDDRLAMTGEVSARGEVKPVGGVVPKIEAAKKAGVIRVLIPLANWLNSFETITGVEIVPIGSLQEAIQEVTGERSEAMNAVAEVLGVGQRVGA
ncbi:MAG: ATP-dependent protease LonB [Solirubrobacterales bacterium]